jgi:hypothetical protein
MSPEDALEKMRIKQAQMAVQAEMMVERVHKLQDLNHCAESGHSWIVERTNGASQTQVDHMRIQCMHCNAWYEIARTYEQNAQITPLCITHNNKDMTVQDFLNGGEEE